nr:immunoglobulin heavy chain junction region [Mus musculus]MBK4195105.1 immunoglobulin heavy chain junction region [Mus musculus]MBK4195565.1 immunoglobulin heavy chain junction region [Mus musculus]MBK4195566.1 immunoglobulin heavy chain junction region [Mus musculus]MBK4195567.1 immunoglobulin heavy chain junction region [Mus musculus]
CARGAYGNYVRYAMDYW